MSKNLKIALVVVAVAAALWAYQFFGTATIAVTSEPAGAVVRVDGRQRGLTPLERLELDVGGHRLEVAHSHYAPHVESLSVSRGDHVKRHVEFKPGEGTFEFISNPRGAWVEVDGVRVPGRTPVTFETSSGPHTIVMGDHERRSVEETHELRHGETKQVSFDLNIDPHGSVTFTLSPLDAKVEFLGKDIVYEPEVRVPMGEYPVRVSRPGYVTQEFRYDVQYGDNVHRVSLERDYGDLRVIVAPSDAEVTVTYRDGGRTQSKRYAAQMRVPVGQVSVRARAIGRRTGMKTFNLSNAGATVRFDLALMTVEVGAVVSDPLRSGGRGPELVVVPGGRFAMGDPNGPPSEVPVREVVLTQPFAVSRHEVTVAQYLAFAERTGRSVSEKLDRDQLDHPMTRINHRDAMAYAAWLAEETGNAYRLLSEAEWEYVARAGRGQSQYFFGDDPNELCTYANIADQSVRKSYRGWEVVDCDDGMIRPGPVGSLQPNPFGLYDIYGNVSEWVLDCNIPSYAKAPTDGSAVTSGVSCETHGYRGGSWDSSAEEARSAYRNSARSGNDDRGIRVMRDL